MRWPNPAGLALLALLAFLARLASPAPALADEPLHACAKLPPDAKLTIQFTPDLTLRELGAWVTGFTCKSVVYDGEAAALAPRLALIATSVVTPRQAVQLFVDTLQKARLVVADRHDTFVVSLDPSVQRRCPAPPSASRPSASASACAKTAADAKLSVSFKPVTTLEDLAIWLAGFTCKRVSFDPSIAASAITVGVIVSARLTPKQATRLFVDAVEATGLAVTEKADGFEVAPGPRWAHCAAAAPPAPGMSPPAPAPAPAVPPPDPAVDVDAVLDAGIRKIDDMHYEISRAALDQITANPIAFAQGAHVVPAMKNGHPDGFKIYAVRPSSLLARIGLLNGDTLQELNGHSLSEPDKALEAYTSLRTSRRAVIGLVRRGAPLTITVKIGK
jgi:hypothetical protein